MSNGPIPLLVEPHKLADRAISFTGELPLAKFTRVAELLTNTAGAVRVSVAFSRDEQKHVVMHLELAAKVAMLCQRCLEDAVISVGGHYDYLIVNHNADSTLLSHSYDVLEVDDEPLDLLALVEDELLLCLPIVPMHPQGECQSPAGYVEPELGPDETTRSNPFSVLAQLKRDPKL